MAPKAASTATTPPTISSPLCPHARAVRFEPSGHAPHLEEPELFNATLKDFAEGLSRARAAQTIES